MEIRIVTIGKLKKKSLLSEIEEYKKKLFHMGVDLNFKELKEATGSNPLAIIKQDEKEIENYKIKSNSYSILLTLDGQELDSQGFAKKIENFMNSGINKIDFYIGGPYGFSSKFTNNFDFKLSLSKMTFPHDFVRLFLIEQIYRAFNIIKGTEYHK